MGMSDKQFQSYQSLLLRRLERALKDAKEDNENVELKELELLIEDLRDELKKP